MRDNLFYGNVPLFSELTDVELEALAGRAQRVEVPAGERVFSEGDDSDSFFLIEAGWVKLVQQGSRTPLVTLGPGSLLGETDFFLGHTHDTTAQANTNLVLHAISDDDIRAVIRENSEIGLKLGLALGNGIVQYREYLLDRVGNIPFLRGMSQELRQDAVDHLNPQQYQSNEVIFRSGDTPSGLYLIESGAVRLISDDGEYAEVGPGETFGEMSVLSGKPHPETAQAVTRSTIWHLAPGDFLRLAETYPRFRSNLSRNLRSYLSAADRVQAIETLGRMALFAELSREELDSVAALLLLRHVQAGDTVFTPGEAGDAMYFVESGQIEVVSEGQVRARLIPGDFFGEMAILTGKSRTVAARAVVNSNLWALYRSDFDRLLVQHPALTVALSRALQDKLSQAEGSFIETHLHKIAITGNLSRIQIDDLSKRLVPRTFHVGDVVFFEGRSGDTMFFVESGRVDLVASGPRGPVVIERLESGDYFGEIAVLSGKNHNATARVAGETVLWALNRQDFEELSFKYPSLAVALSRMLTERQADAMERIRGRAAGIMARPDRGAPRPSRKEPPAKGRPSEGIPTRRSVERPASEEPRPRPGKPGRTGERPEPQPPTPTARPRPRPEPDGEAQRSAPRPRRRPEPPAEMDDRTVRPRPRTAPPPEVDERGRRPQPRPVPPASPESGAPGPRPRPRPVPPAGTERPRPPQDGGPEGGPAARRRPGPPPVPRPEGEAPRRRSVPPAEPRPGAEEEPQIIEHGEMEAEVAPSPEVLERPVVSKPPPPRPRVPGRPAKRPASDGAVTSREPDREKEPGWPERATPRPPKSELASAPSRGMIRGTKLLSRQSEGALGTAAVWFTTRSRRVKVGLLLLLMLLIWLCGITAPAALINELSANLNGGANDAGFTAFAQGGDGSRNDSFLLPGVREGGAVAALPFVETVTPTPSLTPTPTDTPTVTPTPTGTPPPTWTPTPTATDTPLPPTATDTPLPETATPTRPPWTSTPRAPTDTPTPEATPTPVEDYIITNVRQLTPCENEGNHHIYIHLVDINGTGINGIPVRVCWTENEQDCARPITETKERGTGWIEFAMFKGTYNVRVDGAKSQVASGITADYQKDELCATSGNSVANSLFHASFEVTITKVR